MNREKKIALSALGLIIMLIVFIAELISPDANENLHRINSWVSFGGVLMFMIFSFIALRTKKL